MTTAAPARTPLRTCVGCGRKAPQSELARFVARNGELVPDVGRSEAGRGVYTCRRTACFERAALRRSFSRTLRQTVRVPQGLETLFEEG